MAKRLPILLLAFLPLVVKNSRAAVTRQTTIDRLDLAPEMSVAVSLNIQGYLFDLQGLTSPWAKVEFFSTEGNIDLVTIADDQGRFIFRSVSAPIQTGDFCFLSYDVDGLANNPLCFSPPPPRRKTTITGIVLPPTLSIDNFLFRQNEPVKAQGRSFPNAKIQVFMFEEERPWWREQIDVIVPAVFARTGPKLEVLSDQNGLFSFNLPTQKSTRWRFFVGPRIEQENFTAKSNTLTFAALSWWQWFLLKLFRLLYRLLHPLFRFLLRWETVTLLLTILIILTALKIGLFKGQSDRLGKRRTVNHSGDHKPAGRPADHLKNRLAKPIGN